MATHSSILAWEILWTEEPDRLQFIRVAKSQTQKLSMLAVMAWSFWRPGAIRRPPERPPQNKSCSWCSYHSRVYKGSKSSVLGIGAKEQYIHFLLSHDFQSFSLHTHQSLKPELLSMLQWENILAVSKSQSFFITRSHSLISQGLAPTLFLVSFETSVSFSPLDHSYQHKTCSMLSQLKPTIQDKLSLHSLIPSRATFPDSSPQQKFMHVQVPFTHK